MEKNTHKIIFSAVILFALIILSGCAPVISKPTLDSIDKDIAYADIAKDPEKYVGKKVLFGGYIVNTENLKDKSIVEVLQAPLNSDYKPVKSEASEGRFLVAFAGFKDPAVFFKGRRITVAGRVAGAEKRPLDKTTFVYIVLTPDEFYLWRAGIDDEPSVHFGIGLGFSHSF